MNTVQELKYLDTNVIATDVGSAAILKDSLNLVKKGDGQSERIGRKIVIRKLQVSGYVHQKATSSLASSNVIHVLFVLDKQANGGSPGVSDLVHTGGPYTVYNKDYEDRFVYLWDDILVVTSPAARGNSVNEVGTAYKNFKLEIDCDIPILFKAASSPAVIGDVASNNILVYASADVSGLSQVGFHSRIYYDG